MIHKIFQITFTITCLLLIESCGMISNKKNSDQSEQNNPEFKNFEAGEWYNKGNVFKDAKQYKEAIDAYEKSLAIEPSNHSTLLNLGNVYKYNNEFDLAEKCYNEILNSNPKNCKALVSLSDLMLRKQDNNNAVKYSLKAFENSTTEEEKVSSTYNASIAYLNLDSCNNAKKYFELTKLYLHNQLTPMDIEHEKNIKSKCK